MPVFLLIVGVVLLGLDRVIDRAAAIEYQHELEYYVYYYRPLVQRKQFFVIIFLAMCFAAFVNYLIFGKVNIVSLIFILSLIILLIYLLFFLVLVFDYFVLKENTFWFKFFLMERDFIQIFTLALFFPLISLAFLLSIFLVLFMYPSQKLVICNSFAGLLGYFVITASLIMFFL